MSSTTFEDELAVNGRIIYANTGNSMRPLIRQGRDLMIIERRPDARMRRLDVVLYKSNGKYVLHRILKVRENDYVICGDNCIKKEYGIKDSQIIGILTGIIRNGREIKTGDLSYRIYSHIWSDFFHVRKLIKIGFLFVGKIRRKLFVILN